MDWDIPFDRLSGIAPQVAIHHEAGHAVVGDLLGLKPVDIRSHLHPDNVNGGAAGSTHFDTREFEDARGRVLKEKIKPIYVTVLLPEMMAGGIAEELLDGVAVATNKGMIQDRGEAECFLWFDMGYSVADAKKLLKNAAHKAKELLQHQPTLDIMRAYTAEREDGLDRTLHMSFDRLQQMLREIRRARE